MARNVTLPLTADQRSNVLHAASALRTAGKAPVTLTYVKRDGSDSSSTGTVETFVGSESNSSVVILTANKGPRTINLVGVKSVSLA